MNENYTTLAKIVKIKLHNGNFSTIVHDMQLQYLKALYDQVNLSDIRYQIYFLHTTNS